MKHFFAVFLRGALTPVLALLFYIAYLLIASFLGYYTNLLFLFFIMALFLLYCFRSGQRSARSRSSLWNQILFMTVPVLFAILEMFTQLGTQLIPGIILDSTGVPFFLLTQHSPLIYLPIPHVIMYDIGPEALIFLSFRLGEYYEKRNL